MFREVGFPDFSVISYRATELELDCFCRAEDYCRRLTVQNAVLLDRTTVQKYRFTRTYRSIHASAVSSRVTSSF